MVILILSMLTLFVVLVVIAGIVGRGRGRYLTDRIGDQPDPVCVTCGRTLAARVSFCGGCGTRVEDPELVSTITGDGDIPQPRVGPIVAGSALVMVLLGILPALGALIGQRWFLPWGWGTSLLFGRNRDIFQYLELSGKVLAALAVALSALAFTIAMLSLAWARGLTSGRYRTIRYLQFLLAGGVIYYLVVWHFGLDLRTGGDYISVYYSGDEGRNGFALLLVLLGSTLCAVLPPLPAPARELPAPTDVRAPIVGDDGRPARSGVTNGLAVASMVLGIVAWATCALCAPLAIIFGHVSRGQIRRSEGAQNGSGMAMAGLVLGYLAIVLIAAVGGAYWYSLEQADDGSDSWYTSSGYSSSYDPSYDSSSDYGYSSTTTTSYLPTVTTNIPTTTTTTVGSFPSSSYDLGLSQPIANLSCSHEYVTLVGAATDPESYASDVQRILDSVPGSRYQHTASSCSTFARTSKEGTDIYSVYLGPYSTSAEACSQRYRGPDDSYVRYLNGVQSDARIAC